jgi:hypothetical protein
MRRSSVEGHFGQALAILGNVLQIAYRAKDDDLVNRYQDLYLTYAARR